MPAAGFLLVYYFQYVTLAADRIGRENPGNYIFICSTRGKDGRGGVIDCCLRV